MENMLLLLVSTNLTGLMVECLVVCMSVSIKRAVTRFGSDRLSSSVYFPFFLYTWIIPLTSFTLNMHKKNKYQSHHCYAAPMSERINIYWQKSVKKNELISVGCTPSMLCKATSILNDWEQPLCNESLTLQSALGARG